MRLAFFLLLALPGAASAIVVTRAIEAPTIAEIFIEDGKIRVEAESDPGEPDLWRVLELRAGGPHPLRPRLIERYERQKIRRDEITGEPLPAEPGQARMASYAVFEYALEGRPRALTFSGPKIGFIVYHWGLPVIDLHYLEGAQRLALDWRDPWRSRFDNPRLRRQYDARASVFLYVEPYEVRAEMVLRPVDFVSWESPVIPVARQEALKQQVAQLLADSCELAIDGRTVPLRLDRIHFLRRSLWTSSVIDPSENLAAVSAMLGAVFIVPVRGYPQKVALRWKRFGPGLEQVAGSVTDEAGPRPVMLRPERNLLEWENTGRYAAAPPLAAIARPPGRLAWLWPVLGALALVALAAFGVGIAAGVRRKRPLPRKAIAACFLLLLASAGSFTAARSSTIGADQARAILHGLLFNIYRAFDYRQEETVYDLLAASVAGDLLRDVYLETRSALELRNQGGARARVQQVEIVHLELERLSGGQGFRARCVWNVTASIGHWGHIHQRRNRYEAVLTVQPVDGAWKLTGLEGLTSTVQVGCERRSPSAAPIPGGDGGLLTVSQRLPGGESLVL